MLVYTDESSVDSYYCCALNNRPLLQGSIFSLWSHVISYRLSCVTNWWICNRNWVTSLVFSNFSIFILDFSDFLAISSAVWYKMSSLYPTLEDMKVDQVVQVSTIGSRCSYIFMIVLLSWYLTALNQTIWLEEVNVLNLPQKFWLIFPILYLWRDLSIEIRWNFAIEILRTF